MPDQTTPYDRPTDPAKRHSAALTDGPDRAGARSMLKAVGFTDEDLAKPLIGVATTWIETMPCNLNQRRLAEHVKEGIRAAGGTPMEFNTISVSDGVSMGTEGMKASLVSREVIADSIELVVRGHLLDGVVCLAGCDKTMPGAAMALGRLDVPGLILYNGTIYPGTTRASATRPSCRSTRRSARTGPARSASTSCTRSRTPRVPGAGACGGQYTANTMSTVMEFIGLSPAGLNGIPAEDPAKDEAARRAGELVMDLVRRDVRPSAFVTRPSLENGSPRSPRPAARPTASCTCSRSPTSSASRSTSTSSGRSPTGPRSSPTCSRAAATPPRTCTTRAASALVMRELLKRRTCSTATAPTVDGRTIAEIAADAVETDGPGGRRPDRDADQADRRPRDPARHAGARTAAS